MSVQNNNTAKPANDLYTRRTLTHLYRAAATLSEEGHGKFKGIVRDALQLGIISIDGLAKDFNTERTAVLNWSKGNAPTIKAVRSIAGYVAERTKERLNLQ
jgi:hypothetical protein